MKKIFTLLALFTAMLCLQTNSAKAQTAINLQYAGDSTFTSICSAPALVDLFFYGSATGYTATDSLDAVVTFGDGIDSTFRIPANFFQGTSYFNAFFTHVYILPGAYSMQVIVTGPDGNADTLSDNSILIATSCGDISGRVYVDGNSNCNYNAGETPVQTWVAATFGGQTIAMTLSDANGEYFLSVPSGFTYVVTLPYLSGGTVVCPSSNQITVASLPSAGNNFGLVCTGNDLSGNISGQGFRNNAQTAVWISAFNKLISCAPPTATVTVTLDPQLSYVSSSVTPTSVSGSTITFNAGQLSGLSNYEFYASLTLLTNISATIGDTLCITLTIDPVSGDADPSDNTVTVCMPVRNSCDPNEKYEIHAGAATGNIAPGEELSYTIMFQNVGNDVAYDINVLDDLDANVDLSTLRITGYSHPATFSLSDNKMQFQFKNINLDAASVNEPKSHGFITYKIKPKAGLALGTAINNLAKIYFDFNAPIITNTVTDILATPTGLNAVSYNKNLVLYPNPADKYFRVKTGSTEAALLTIYDVTGRTVILTQQVMNEQEVSTKNLNAGMYYVTLVSNAVTSATKLTVK